LNASRKGTLKLEGIKEKITAELAGLDGISKTIELVIIPAGGKGTRLRPYTLGMLKPLFYFENKPILQQILDRLDHKMIKKIVVISDYLYPQIQTFIEHYQTDMAEENKKVTIENVVARETSVCDKIKLLEDSITKLTTPFIVHYSDVVLNNFDWDFFVKCHQKFRKEHRVIGTLTWSNYYPMGVGLIYEKSDRANLLEKLVEKENRIPGFKINVGVSIFERDILHYVEKGDDLYQDVIPRALKNGQQFGLYQHANSWFHLETIDGINNYQQSWWAHKNQRRH
jgi:NDP-sugar pyrophosphorylase family protein